MEKTTFHVTVDRRKFGKMYKDPVYSNKLLISVLAGWRQEDQESKSLSIPLKNKGHTKLYNIPS